MACNAHDTLDPIIQAIFRRKARQIVGGARNADNVEDIEHDLLVAFFQRLPHFDPQRANLHAFANVVANHAMADYWRSRGVRKRNARQVVACSTPILGSDGAMEELGVFINQRQLDARRGADAPDAQEAASLAHDVAAVLDRLSPRQRALAERLQAGDSLSSIAREFGIPRTTISDWVRKLRVTFEVAGLRDYLHDLYRRRSSSEVHFA